MFYELHCHTDEGSNLRLLDTTNKVKTVMNYAAEIGLGGVAITDHESLSSHIEVNMYAKELLNKEENKKAIEDINKLGVGPMGFGGKVTCLGVKINAYPCHIASLPVAINIQCHASRHKSCIL